MDTYGTCQLGNTCNRKLDLLAGRHDQITELIDDDDDVRHVVVTVGQAELMVHVLMVILLNIARTSHLQQIVAVVHQFTEGVERTDHLGNVRDDSLLIAGFIGNLGHEVVHDRRIDGEFHLLWVNKHELQLVGMFLI